MSRGRELSKVGGLTQTIAGISTFVGISTFASDVRIHGKLDVDGDISYDEMTAVNQKLTGISTVNDIRVDRNRSGWEDHSINMGPQKPIALINPPVKVTTKIAYDNQMQQQQQANAAEPPRQDLPEFNPSSMRSMAKIKTLGIVV